MTKIQHVLHLLHMHRVTVFIALTLLILVLGFLNFNSAEAPEVLELPDNDISVSLKIGNRFQDNEYTISQGDTVLDALAVLDALDPELKLTTEYYEGLGALITSMYGLENGTDGNYWQYEVNEVMPQIGASAYELQDNDTVYWQFTESQY